MWAPVVARIRSYWPHCRLCCQCRHECGGQCCPPTAAAAPAASMTMDLNVSSRAPLCSPPLALDKASASSPPVSAPSPVSSSAPGKRSFDVAFLVGPDERLEAARSGKQARAADAHPQCHPQPHPQAQPHGQLRVVTASALLRRPPAPPSPPPHQPPAPQLYYHSEDYIRSAFTKGSGGSELLLKAAVPSLGAGMGPRLYPGGVSGHEAYLPALCYPPFADLLVAAAALLPPSLAALSLPAQNVCAKCNVSFRMTSDLVYHMRSHHKGESQAEALRRRRDQDKLRCPVCAETFRERHHLTRHMTAHQDKEGDLVDDK
ncbi:PR domain zinc finger protein 8 [Schistocerca cancellata]|uniref:PR domain zinc finger protein 8 n=1 Tax=Schistocerca cancellata TaxID=274614 RepID=UPI0021176AEA|nr:PR domain zinc finger protein 8 [Schistocerca cancellata]